VGVPTAHVRLQLPEHRQNVVVLSHDSEHPALSPQSTMHSLWPLQFTMVFAPTVTEQFALTQETVAFAPTVITHVLSVQLIVESSPTLP
jgi:hypothetical protein